MLKSNILQQLPNCRVRVSKPTIRIDHGKANLTLRNVNKRLNSKGKGRLAINFLNQIRKFWPVEHLNEPLSPNNQSDQVNIEFREI